MLGLGDSSYPSFRAIGRVLDARLAELRGTRLITAGEAVAPVCARATALGRTSTRTSASGCRRTRPATWIGPGTGIAPFRAFLQQRTATAARGRKCLFFGNTHLRATTRPRTAACRGWTSPSPATARARSLRHCNIYFPDLCRWHGVRERWLIDVVNSLISIHRHEGRGYATPDQRCTECRIAVGVPPVVELGLHFAAAHRPVDQEDAAPP